MKATGSDRNLQKIRAKAKTCRACPLYKQATQMVFGEGPGRARIMIVGEQPGDQEDLQGHPFVGPAGRILDQALERVGLSHESVYLTNAVKHFKWKRAGKRRLHQKPNAAEISACQMWLASEVALIQPRVIVALGVSAGQAVLGRVPKVTRERGKKLSSRESLGGVDVILTWHPSAILRTRDRKEKELRLKQLAADLRRAEAKK